MRNSMLSFFIVLFFSIPGKTFGQETINSNRLEFVAGMANNFLSWESMDTMGQSYSKKRNGFDPKPIFRVSYNKLLSGKGKTGLGFKSFLGGSVLGGSAKEVTNGYMDVYNIYCIELGLLPSLVINQRFQFEAGIKEQVFLFAIEKSYHTGNNQNGWDVRQANWFKRFSMDIGGGFLYFAGRKLSFGMEYWYGITNLNKTGSMFTNTKISGQSIRITCGYNLARKTRNDR